MSECTLSGMAGQMAIILWRDQKLLSFSIEHVLTGSRCCGSLYQACIQTNEQPLSVGTDPAKGAVCATVCHLGLQYVKHSGWIRGCLIRRKASQEHLSSLFYYYHSFQFLCADEILRWGKGLKFGSASVTSKSSMRLIGWSLLETSFRLN